MPIPGNGLDTPEHNRRRDARQNGLLTQAPPPPPPEDDEREEHWAKRYLNENGKAVTVQNLSFQREDGSVIVPNVDGLGNTVKESDAPLVMPQVTPPGSPILSDGADDLDAAMASFAQIEAPVRIVARSDNTVPLIDFAPPVDAEGIVPLVDASQGVTLTVATLAYVQAWEKRMEAWLVAERAKDAAHRRKQDQAIGNVLRAVSALLAKS